MAPTKLVIRRMIFVESDKKVKNCRIYIITASYFSPK